MSRYIDADVILDTVFEVHCKECERRKGIKNGKLKVIYEVGEAPCKSCGVNDMREYLEDAPKADVVEVVRCKDCKWFNQIGCAIRIVDDSDKPTENDFCSFAERRE